MNILEIPNALQTRLPFPAGSEVGALMYTRDWSSSPLGDPETWPQSLRSVVSLMLNSRFPMFVAWGPELGFVYNDAYAEILGAKHPAALGRAFKDIWGEIWSDISPFIDRALAGEATWVEDMLLIMRRHGFDEATWFTFSYSPVYDESGAVAGMFCACTETTRQVLAERENAAQRERLERMFEQAPGFMAMLRGPEHVFELANTAYLQLIGDRQIIGKPAREAIPEVEGQGFFELLDRAYRTGEAFAARAMPITFRRGAEGAPEERFLDFVYQPVTDTDGRVSGIFVEGYDVTERKRGEDHQRLLIDELNHRVKNTLAIIQGIAQQTFKGAAATPQARAAFEGRLAALAATHNLLTRQNWGALPIREVIDETLLPFRGNGRFTIDGPNLLITSKLAVTLALALNELATNAAKYGSLSQPGGRVEIGWRVEPGDGGDRFRLVWRERGGPDVVPPVSRGFGTRMIERGLAAELNGRVKIDFQPAGIVCTVDAPLPRAEA